MGLTILAFITVPAFIALFVFVARRGLGQSGAAALLFISALLSLYALFQGLIFAFTDPGFSPSLALSLERFSGSLLVLVHVFIFLFAIDFPSSAPGILRRLVWVVSVPAALVAAYAASSGFDYMVSVYRPWTTIFRIEGRYYDYFVFGDAAVAFLAFAILAIRALAAKSRVHKQKAAIAAFFVIAGEALILLSTGLISGGEAKRPIFVFAPAGALILAGGMTYAFRQSRLFDWRVITRTFLGYGTLLLVVGLPAGAATALAKSLAGESSMATAVASVVIFAAAAVFAKLFMNRYFTRLSNRGDYRALLETELASLDLSQGRDAVLDQLYARLSRSLDFTDFCVLIDDDQGFLRTVFAPTGGRATIERGSALAEMIEKTGASVILKTEAEEDVAYKDQRAALLELFEALKAEAIIVALEGRRAIGLFSLGARNTGGEYTAYDRESFQSIYGRLFVAAYYLKNIARESIMTTVDREIALSDQIIRFALEKVDRIEHPKADAAWVSKSARSLGGDFIDFVRLSQDRWFVVMGDVSGKGLSASMNMLILKSMIRTFLRVEKDFVTLVARVNAFIKENLPKGTFFAGIFGYLDLSKDAFYYVNCGVPTMMLYSPAFDTFIEVQGEGRILGFVKDVKPYLKPRRLALGSGTALVAATDGMLDSENLRGERFGKERLRRSVHGRLALTAAEISAGAIDDLAAFTDNRQEDDVTLFVMKLRSDK
jgi:Serine phosphatase RsbU, regulator of sigma subunit